MVAARIIELKQSTSASMPVLRIATRLNYCLRSHRTAFLFFGFVLMGKPDGMGTLQLKGSCAEVG